MSIFRFKQFEMDQTHSPFKIGTDGVLVAAWAKIGHAKRVLDIGTGSGLIALISAQRNQDADITAIDINPEALEVADYNIGKSPWSNRITSHLSPIQDFESAPFDHIICNPPFFKNSQKCVDPSKNLARHTDSLSFEELFNHATRLLSDQGKMTFVLPVDSMQEFIDLANKHKLTLTRRLYARPRVNKAIHRVVLEFSKQKAPLQDREIFIEKGRHIYSDDYADLSRDLYLLL